MRLYRWRDCPESLIRYVVAENKSQAAYFMSCNYPAAAREIHRDHMEEVDCHFSADSWRFREALRA